MIKFATNISAAVAVLLAFASSSSLLLGSAIALLFSLLVLRDRQNKKLNQRLHHVYSKLQTASRQRRRREQAEIGSSVIVEKLDEKIESLVGEIDDLRRQASYRAELPAPTISGATAPANLQHFSTQLAKFISSRIRAQLVMIQIAEQNGQTNSSFDGLDDERARLLIQDWVSPYLFSRETTHLGAHTVCRDKGRLSGLSHFGISQILCHSLALASPESRPRTLVICAAYSGEQRSLEQELALLEQVAGQAQHDLNQCSRHKVIATPEVEQPRQHSLIERDHLAHISHDLRSPLNNIKAILNLLSLQPVDPSNGDLVTSALSNCSHLEELVEGILDYTQYKAGKLESRSEVFDVNSCIKELVENFRVSAKVKDISLKLEAREPFNVFADKRQVRRIVSNLISNALKYTEKGSVSLSISQGQAGRVVISVKDTGYGMNAAQLAKLFTPFTRFHGSHEDGVGLGLAVSRILAEKNSGTLKAQSEKGKGSVFSLDLPKALAATTVVKQSKKRILLMDDDIECIRTLARLIQGDQRELVLCHSEERAIAHLSNEKIDLIISDNQMPLGGASYLFEKVENLPPVIIITGETNPERHTQLKAMGASDILTKPVEPDQLSRAIEKNMESRDSNQSLVA